MKHDDDQGGAVADQLTPGSANAVHAALNRDLKAIAHYITCAETTQAHTTAAFWREQVTPLLVAIGELYGDAQRQRSAELFERSSATARAGEDG